MRNYWTLSTVKENTSFEFVRWIKSGEDYKGAFHRTLETISAWFICGELSEKTILYAINEVIKCYKHYESEVK